MSVTSIMNIMMVSSVLLIAATLWFTLVCAYVEYISRKRLQGHAVNTKKLKFNFWLQHRTIFRIRQIRVKLKFLIILFSPVFCYFIFLASKYSSLRLFPDMLNLRPSLKMRGHTSHPYKTINKISCVSFIFTFLNSKRENKRFWTKQ